MLPARRSAGAQQGPQLLPSYPAAPATGTHMTLAHPLPPSPPGPNPCPGSTLLTSKGPRKGPVPGSRGAVPAAECLPTSGERGGCSFRLPLPLPPETLTSLLGSPAALCLTLPVHRGEPSCPGQCPMGPSSCPHSGQRESTTLLPQGQGQKGEGEGPAL